MRSRGALAGRSASARCWRWPSAEMLGGAPDDALDLACAVELVHCCSLVLDDLPAMDDAHLRRGRPTLHREYGEDVALLAAFALLNRGYALVAEASQRLRLSRYSPGGAPAPPRPGDRHRRADRRPGARSGEWRGLSGASPTSSTSTVTRPAPSSSRRRSSARWRSMRGAGTSRRSAPSRRTSGSPSRSRTISWTSSRPARETGKDDGQDATEVDLREAARRGGGALSRRRAARVCARLGGALRAQGRGAARAGRVRARSRKPLEPGQPAAGRRSGPGRR